LGSEPKAYWYLSRASAMVAYGLLWLSMALGLIITNKLARVWPGGPIAFDLHQFASLIGLAFALFHALILMGDKYINYDLAQVLVPFNSSGYKPVWVGLGQIGFYLLAIVGLSFYVRKRLGNRSWRLIHYFSFLTFALALLHGIFAGTDSTVMAIQIFYWATGASLLFLLVYRILITKFAAKKAARVTAA
jgi:predicted ferric reductase